jgi:phage gp45-like
MSKGFGDDLFMPEEEISRQDMMVLVDKALQLSGNKLAAGVAEDVANFTDSADVAGYAVNSVATLVKGGVVKGSENMLNPKGRTTRAEVASILYNLYNK